MHFKPLLERGLVDADLLDVVDLPGYREPPSRFPHFIQTEQLHFCIFSVDMNIMSDTEAIQRLSTAQAGVFSKADLQTTLGEPHPSAFVRRIRNLIESGCLTRFCRGWYVTKSFQLPILSQRLAPASYISFGTVLAAHGVLGTRSALQVVAVKDSPARNYRSERFSIEHVMLSHELLFGFSSQGGANFADVEKALLDTLYFHLRGRRYAFDIYSDLNGSPLDFPKLRGYLQRYKNPKFRTFAERIIAEL